MKVDIVYFLVMHDLTPSFIAENPQDILNWDVSSIETSADLSAISDLEDEFETTSPTTVKVLVNTLSLLGAH